MLVTLVRDQPKHADLRTSRGALAHSNGASIDFKLRLLGSRFGCLSIVLQGCVSASDLHRWSYHHRLRSNALDFRPNGIVRMSSWAWINGKATHQPMLLGPQSASGPEKRACFDYRAAPFPLPPAAPGQCTPGPHLATLHPRPIGC
jgi:hypothetical protein